MSHHGCSDKAGSDSAPLHSIHSPGTNRSTRHCQNPTIPPSVMAPGITIPLLPSRPQTFHFHYSSGVISESALPLPSTLLAAPGRREIHHCCNPLVSSSVLRLRPIIL